IPIAQPGPSLRFQRANIASTLAANWAYLPLRSLAASAGAQVVRRAMRITNPNAPLIRHRVDMLLLLYHLTLRPSSVACSCAALLGFPPHGPDGCVVRRPASRISYKRPVEFNVLLGCKPRSDILVAKLARRHAHHLRMRTAARDDRRLVLDRDLFEAAFLKQCG